MKTKKRQADCLKHMPGEERVQLTVNQGEVLADHGRGFQTEGTPLWEVYEARSLGEILVLAGLWIACVNAWEGCNSQFYETQQRKQGWLVR